MLAIICTCTTRSAAGRQPRPVSSKGSYGDASQPVSVMTVGGALSDGVPARGAPSQAKSLVDPCQYVAHPIGLPVWRHQLGGARVPSGYAGTVLTMWPRSFQFACLNGAIWTFHVISNHSNLLA